MLLLVRPLKSDRFFACMLRTVIVTMGMVRNINIIRSPGRATDVRSRAQAKGRRRPFLPALKRYSEVLVACVEQLRPSFHERFARWAARASWLSKVRRQQTPHVNSWVHLGFRGDLANV